jgi:hypothetical protein
LFLAILWCSWSGWRSSIRCFSQIWLHTRYESSPPKEKKTEFFHISGYFLELLIRIWRFEFYFFFEIWLIWNLLFFLPIKNPLYR